MPATATCRADVEALLRARKLDRTLVAVTDTSGTTVVPETMQTGLSQLDQQLGGGIPVGHFSEIVGPRSSGRTSLLFSLLATLTTRGELVALIDTFDVFDAESADAAGVRLENLLWVRGDACTPAFPLMATRQTGADRSIERAVKAANLVLQAGGFSLVALDLADAPVQALRRIPMNTWMRLQRVIEGQPSAGIVLSAAPLSRSAGGVSIVLQQRNETRTSALLMGAGDGGALRSKPCERGEHGRTTHASQGPTAAWGDGVGPRATTDSFPEMHVSAASSGLQRSAKPSQGSGLWASTDGETTIFHGLESDVQIQRSRLLPGVSRRPVRLRASAVA
jgi:recombination protein RecA